MKEFGIFNDEGCIEDGFYSREEAEAAVINNYPDEDGVEVAPICEEHEEQDANHCMICNEEID